MGADLDPDLGFDTLKQRGGDQPNPPPRASGVGSNRPDELHGTRRGEDERERGEDDAYLGSGSVGDGEEREEEVVVVVVDRVGDDEAGARRGGGGQTRN
jgi:hypothetical protein